MCNKKETDHDHDLNIFPRTHQDYVEWLRVELDKYNLNTNHEVVKK